MAEFVYTDDHRLTPFGRTGIPEDADVSCFHCGSKHPAAYWSPDYRPDRPLIVCRRCAVEVLPRLIADAVAGQSKGTRPIEGDFRDAIRTVELNYWRAAAGALRIACGRLWNKNRELFNAMHAEDVDV